MAAGGCKRYGCVGVNVGVEGLGLGGRLLLLLVPVTAGVRPAGPYDPDLRSDSDRDGIVGSGIGSYRDGIGSVNGASLLSSLSSSISESP